MSFCTSALVGFVPMVAVAIGLAAVAPAQCDPFWASTGSANGTDFSVFASAPWDPDGSGPLAPRIALAGSFVFAGGARSPAVAAWDPATGAFTALPGLSSGDGLCALGLANGDLVVGGWLAVSGQAGSNLVRWHAGAWQRLANMDNLVYGLAELGNGDLVAVGSFTFAGGAACNRIARWNGATWSPLGTGLDGPAYAVVRMPNGDLVVGGGFTHAGGVPVAGVARWNGTAWSSVGGFGMSTAMALCVLANGDLVVGGSDLLRWDGFLWHTMGFTSNHQVNAIAETANGDLLVTGGFTTVNGAACNRVARLANGSWQALGAGLGGSGTVVGQTLCAVPGGGAFVGGRFTQAGGRVANYAVRWGADLAWHSLGNGLGGEVLSLAALPGGDFVAGGLFRAAGDQDLLGVARWNGTGWQPLGTGLAAAARALLVLPNGDLVAAGLQTFSSNIGVFRGGAWQPMGSGIPGEVRCLARATNGDVFAGGQFNWAGNGPALAVARWNGTAWSPLGAGLDNRVNALCVLPNGDLIAGGNFNASGFVPVAKAARWDGATWSPLGNGPGTEVLALTVMPNGDLIAGGDIGGGPSRTVQRWNGSTWQTVGTGANQSVRALAVLPSGTLIAGGAFNVIGNIPASGLAIWDGSHWGELAGGAAPTVGALATLAGGDLAVGGPFATVGSFNTGNQLGSPNAAVLQIPCGAEVTTMPTACVGPAGPVVVVPTSPLRTGGTWQAQANGLAAGAAALWLVGLGSPQVPLASLHPAGLPGCDLLASLDAVVLTPVVAGASSYQFQLPLAPALSGLVAFQQCLQLVDVAGAPTLSGSNGLRLVVGTL